MNIVDKSHMNVLIQLAKADKDFSVEERDMIFRVGHDHNFSDAEIVNLMGNPEPVGTLGALSPSQKLSYLLNCVELIFVDKKVLESELKFCRSIAMKMGLKINVIDFLIENRTTLQKNELQDRIFSGYIL
jgi:hypothetical protein